MSTSLEQVLEEVERLLQEFHSFPNASEDFWKVHDRIVKLAYHGIEISNEEKKSEIRQRLREVLEELKQNTPSGYWK